MFSKPYMVSLESPCIKVIPPPPTTTTTTTTTTRVASRPAGLRPQVKITVLLTYPQGEQWLTFGGAFLSTKKWQWCVLGCQVKLGGPQPEAQGGNQGGTSAQVQVHAVKLGSYNWMFFKDLRGFNANLVQPPFQRVMFDLFRIAAWVRSA